MTTALPPIVDRATWRRRREQLLGREKAHTREGDAIAAARRRLPMTEVDGSVELVGADGPTTVLDMFGDRDQLVVCKHMWDGPRTRPRAGSAATAGPSPSGPARV